MGGATQYFQISPQASGLVGVLAAIDGPLKGKLYAVGDGDTRLGRCRVWRYTVTKWVE